MIERKMALAMARDWIDAWNALERPFDELIVQDPRVLPSAIRGVAPQRDVGESARAAGPHSIVIRKGQAATTTRRPMRHGREPVRSQPRGRRGDPRYGVLGLQDLPDSERRPYDRHRGPVSWPGAR